MNQYLAADFTKGNERSVAVKKNIAVSLVLKCISILVSLQVVPLTAGYEEIFDKDFVEWADSPAEEADLSAEK